MDCNSCCDNCDAVATPPYVVYICSASDASGDGFVASFNPALPYIGILSTPFVGTPTFNTPGTWAWYPINDVAGKYQMLFTDDESHFTDNLTLTTLNQFTIPAGTLGIGDKAIMNFCLFNGNIDNSVIGQDIGSATLTVTIGSSEFTFPVVFIAGQWYIYGTLTISVINATTIRFEWKYRNCGAFGTFINEYDMTQGVSTVPSIGTTPIVLLVQGQSVNYNSDMKIQQFSVEQKIYL